MMTPQVALLSGLAIGFSIAVPIGPMGLLCIQRTLASGMRVGFCTGLGAATVNVFYGALVIVGFGSLSPLVAGGSRMLSFAGGVFLLWSAARTLLRKPSHLGQTCPLPLRPLTAYGSAVAFNAANPLSPLLVIALLSPVIGPHAPSWPAAAILLTGMFTAAASWWACLSGGISLLRSRLSPAVLVTVNQAAAALLTVYGALALARSAGM